jgi:hypothetical protein
MTIFYNKAYYQRYMDGNCDNGNCTNNCNCGNKNCSNCIITGRVNCANCDTQRWLQTNCNSAVAPVYNCTTSGTTVNCDCSCSFNPLPIIAAVAVVALTIETGGTVGPNFGPPSLYA